MPVLVRLLLGRYTRRLALKALKSKRVRRALLDKRTRRLVSRQLARVLSRRR